jgi:hypothetical protein
MNATAVPAVIFKVKRGNSEKKSKGKAIKIHVYKHDQRNLVSSCV